MLADSYIFVISIAAYYSLKDRFTKIADSMMRIGLVTASIVLVLQLLSGDSSANLVAKHQPAKLAAMEGIYKTEEYTPIYAFGWVDTKNEKTYGFKIPGGLSLLIHRAFKPAVTGLDKFAKEDRPPVQIVFQMYHLMVLCWGLMFLLATGGLYLYKKGRLITNRWLLWIMVFSVFIPSCAIQAGWYVTEVGRQPWLVYGLLRTAQGVCPFITATQLKGSIAMFAFIYPLLFALFIYMVIQKVKVGPKIDP